MDEETLTRYATAYAVPVDDIRAWFDGLDTDTQSIVAECFRRGEPPKGRTATLTYVQRYRLYDAALSSFAAFVAERWTELLAGAVS